MSEQLRELRHCEASLVKDSAKGFRMQGRARVHRDRYSSLWPIGVSKLDVAAALAEFPPPSAFQSTKCFGWSYSRQLLSHCVLPLERREAERRELVGVAAGPVGGGHAG